MPQNEAYNLMGAIGASCRVCMFITGASLSEPHSNMESGTVVHERRTVTKTRLQHTRYGGSCKSKYDKLTYTYYIQVLVKRKYLALCTDAPYLAGTVNHATKNKR